MKRKKMTTIKRLAVIALSLVLVGCAAVSSLSAATEPVRADVTVSDVSARLSGSDKADVVEAETAVLNTDEPALSAATEAPYAVAEGSLDVVPEDDEVLDIDLQPSDEPQEKPILNRKANVDLTATGAAVTSGSLDTSKTYYLGADSDTYRLVYENGWKVKRTSDGYYYNLTYSNWTVSGAWNNSGTTSYTVSQANSSGVSINCTVNYSPYYLSYSGGNISANQNSSNRISVYEAAVTYTVTFNKNDGSGTTTTQSNVPANTATALTANSFTRSGYVFDGWNTAADGSGTDYADGASVSLSADLTLYAQWVVDTNVTLYFTLPSGWNHLRAYLWKDGTDTNNTWPGAGMSWVKTNDYSEQIYSITFDPATYDRVIFNDCGDNNDGARTVTINVNDAVANGSGIYIINSTQDEGDGKTHYHVNCYTYNESSTGDSNTISYTKQIEKKNPNNDDDYNYRLHLTVDGSALNETQIVPGTDTVKGLSGALIIDVTATMAATWTGSGSNVKKGEQAFQAIYDSNSFLGQFLAANENNQLTVIGMRGDDQSTYNASNNMQSVLINGWAETVSKSFSTYEMTGVQPNYIASLLRAKEQFASATATNDQAIIFITGNAPKYVSNNDGTSKGRAYDHAENAETDTKNFIDWFFTQNPNISIYVVGMETFGSGTSTVAKYMGNKSVEVTGKGGYFAVTNLNEMKGVLNNTILPDVVVSGDKTSNITVTDTLSQYVDFASNKNLTATLYTGLDNGSWTTSTDISSAVSYNGKTITFSRAAEIEGPFKIEIAFDIKTADGIYKDTATYGTSGYSNTGDSNTDYTTATSAGQRGYYANASATVGYTLNGTSASGVFIKPVVQAPATAPVQGSYIFKYTDRYGDEQEVTVPVTLNSSEINGYTGNGNQAGVPTFLWTSEAQTLFNSVNPLVTAALALEGNDNWQKDASVYKNDLVWNNLVATTQGSNITYDATAHTLTVTAATTPYTFTLMYYTVNSGTTTHQGTASGLVYGKAVTFNPIYSESTEYAYVNYTVPSEGFSYWSADAAGAIPITTNLTYGMIMRGDYTDDGDNDRTVRIYAQYNKTISEAWKPLIEEVKLTRTIDDDHDWVYLDYMTNYLSQAGTVVQEMEVKPEYGIVVAKYDSEQTTLTQAKMEQIAGLMIGSGGSNGKSSAYLNSEKTAIAYRFNYSDNEHISDFNRVLYTLKSNTADADEKQFTAIAYIVVDGTKYYSPINTDITVIDLV